MKDTDEMVGEIIEAIKKFPDKTLRFEIVDKEGIKIKDNETGEIFTQSEILSKLANQVNKLEKKMDKKYGKT